MTPMRTMISGIYPRSRVLAQATRDHDRGRIDDATLHERFQADRTALIRLQQEHGYGLLSDGLLNWQDHFRPFVEASEGLSAGALVRFFDTNTFYRRPRIGSRVALDPRRLVPYFYRETAGSWVATVPGLATWVEMSAGSEAARWEAALSLTRRAIVWLAQQGYAAVQLYDPWLGYHGAALERGRRETLARALGELLEEVRAGAAAPAIGLHLPFGDGAAALETLWPLPLDWIGLDFYQTELAALDRYPWSERGLLVGCLDGRNSRLEDEARLEAFLETVLKLAPKTLYLSNNVDLQLVPEPIARAKVALLGRLARRFTSARKEGP